MSYADVAARNAPPPSEQPYPNPSLLNTEPSVVDNVADDTAKVNVVSSDFKSNPATTTSQAAPIFHRDGGEFPDPDHHPKNKSRKRLHEVEAEGVYLWDVAKQYLLRPGVAGGLLGLVNIGLLSSASYAFYTKPHLRRDTTVISSAIAGALLLFSTEGYAAEKYRQTPRGQAEERRAREKGSLIFTHAREQILRPGVLGGLLGLVNTAILGALGYYSYINWDRPTWDRRVVSTISVGLLTLWGGEGYIAEHYRKSRK